MAGPGDEIAAGAGGRGRLRASHADREQVIEVLKAAFVQGRLDRDEFDLRVGRALASRTYADLATLTADIDPARLTRARPPEPARESVNNKKKAVAVLACATPAIVGMLAAPLPDGSPFAEPVLVLMCVLFGAVFNRLASAVPRMARRARWQAVRAGAATGRRRRGIPEPGTGRPGRTAPAGRSRSVASGRGCADPPPPPGIAQLADAESNVPPRAPVRDRLPRLLTRPRRAPLRAGRRHRSP